MEGSGLLRLKLVSRKKLIVEARAGIQDFITNLIRAGNPSDTTQLGKQVPFEAQRKHHHFLSSA